MISNKELYTMKLHEIKKLNEYLTIIRVAGGWIYNTYTESSNTATESSVFVPYSGEFSNYNRPKVVGPRR